MSCNELALFELSRWANECHPNVSIHTFHVTYKFHTYIGPTRHISLVYVVKDDHLFPITDKGLIITATKVN